MAASSVPCRIEAGRLHVAEAERRQAAVGALALVGVHALRLEAEGDRVLAVRPLQVVLQRVVVQILGERPRVGAAPLRRRVRAGERDFGERLNRPRRPAVRAEPALIG